METLVRAAPNGAFSSIIKDRGRDGWRRRWLLTMVSSAALAVAGTQIAAADAPRMQRVLQGLRPPVEAVGRPPVRWTIAGTDPIAKQARFP